MEVGSDAAPAGGGNATSALGRRRTPPSGHDDPDARSSLTRWLWPVAKARPGAGRRRDGAPRGAHPQPEGAHASPGVDTERMRRSALRPLAYREGQSGRPAIPAFAGTGAGKDYGAPGAAKNTGDDACALFPSPRNAGRGGRALWPYCNTFRTFKP